MRILCVSGYPAWNKVSKKEMPSHHLYGIHEMIDHYVENNKSLRGVIKTDILEGGYVDFYLWRSGKSNILKQTLELLRICKNYDIVYDTLNRCSFYLGVFRKCKIMKSLLVTVMHHPPYKLQLCIANSDAYVFFDEDYKKIAEKTSFKKTERFFVNEWRPDILWYQSNCDMKESDSSDCFYIDNGKSRRDRDVLIRASEIANVRVDYAGDFDCIEGWARSYKVDLKDDIAQLKKLKKYKAIVIPIQESKKERIGPLGITSYMDAVSLGIPVIASDNACFAKDIIRLKVGIVYKTGDCEDLANALRTLQSDASLYNSCVENMKLFNRSSIVDYSFNLQNIFHFVMKK